MSTFIVESNRTEPDIEVEIVFAESPNTNAEDGDVVTMETGARLDAP